MDEQTPLILVGNKLDLADERREVSWDEAEALARSWGVPYVETSAKTKVNVDKVYFDLLSKIQQKKELAHGAGSTPGGKKKKKKKKKCIIL